MKRQKPHIKVLVLWQLRTVLFCLLPSVLVSVLFTIGSFFWNVATLAWLIIAVLMVFVYFPVRYLRAGFAVDKNWLVVSEGSVYGRTRSLPLANIQFITLAHSPMERLLGLETVICHGAGGRVFVVGLPTATAVELVELLSKKAV